MLTKYCESAAEAGESAMAVDAGCSLDKLNSDQIGAGNVG